MDTDSGVSDVSYVIESENLVKIYKKRDVEVVALQGLDLKVERGEVMAIVGNSGSGKSTLLNMIGGLDRPSAGRLYVAGKDLFALSQAELVEYKRSTVGFVWQNNARNLLPYLTVLENVMMPMQFALERQYTSGADRKEKAVGLLELVGLKHKKNSRLSGLSGGEQQRAAIAIALSNSPEVLLADEPTGSVDAATSAYLLDAFRQVNRDFGTTIVIVTHDREVAKKVNRVVLIRDGKVSSEMIATRKSLDGAFFGSGAGGDATGGADGADDADGTGGDGTGGIGGVGGISGNYGAYAFDGIIGAGVGSGSQIQFEHEEFAVLDRTGRLQLPAEYLEQLHIKGNKVKVGIEDGKLVISAPKGGATDH